MFDVGFASVVVAFLLVAAKLEEAMSLTASREADGHAARCRRRRGGLRMRATML